MSPEHISPHKDEYLIGSNHVPFFPSTSIGLAERGFGWIEDQHGNWIRGNKLHIANDGGERIYTLTTEQNDYFWNVLVEKSVVFNEFTAGDQIHLAKGVKYSPLEVLGNTLEQQSAPFAMRQFRKSKSPAK